MLMFVLWKHEFGIYGVKAVFYILPLINRLEKPLVSILHTILRRANYVQRIVIRELQNNHQKL